MEEIKKLFDLLDSVKESDAIWDANCEESGSDNKCFEFRWGHKEYLLPMDFCGNYYVNNNVQNCYCYYEGRFYDEAIKNSDEEKSAEKHQNKNDKHIDDYDLER